MSQKECIQLASRAVALVLLVSSLGWFVSVPVHFHSVLHYRSIFPRTPQQDYIYTNDFLLLLTHIAASAVFFVGAVWMSRCGPTIQRFLSPSEE
jgi:hypothetical protein